MAEINEVNGARNLASNTALLAMLVGGEMAKALAAKPLSEVFGFTSPRQMSLGEELATYVAHPAIAAAKELLARCAEEQLKQHLDCLSSPAAVRSLLTTRIGCLEYEAFWCLWLDAQHRMIAAEEVFRGTLTQTSVYPREIVKKALSRNAAAVILAHNHPSGVVEPSRADEMLTVTIKSALALVGVKVLDHFVVSGAQALSFAERGLL